MQAFGQNLRPVAPPYAYALVSLSNVAATTCQYEALKCARPFTLGVANS